MAAPANETTYKQYLSFFFGQQFSLLGSSIVQFAIVWWINLETASTLYLSLAAFVGFVPMVVLGFFTGVLADRFNRKIIIALADFAQAFITVLLIVSFLMGWASIFVVLVLLAFRGVCQAFHAPTVSAIVPSMVPQNRLSRMNSLEYVLNGAVNVAGPLIAAILLAFVRIEQILWIDPATFLVAVIILLVTKIPSVRETHETTSFKEDFMQGFAFIRSARGLLPLIFLATVLNFLIMPISTLLPYFVKFDHLGVASDLAMVEAVIQGGLLAGGLFMLISKGFKKKIAAFVISILIYLIGYAIVSLTPLGLFWFMAVAGLVFSLPVPIANVSVRTIIQTVVPLKIQGRVSSVIMSLASLASPLGMIMSGALANYVGTANLFLGSALLGVLVLVPSWFLTDIRHVEDMQTNVKPTDSSLIESNTPKE
jgi:DHA3 family macrolide efflux protein-like MFS transporter